MSDYAEMTATTLTAPPAPAPHLFCPHYLSIESPGQISLYEECKLIDLMYVTSQNQTTL